MHKLFLLTLCVGLLGGTGRSLAQRTLSELRDDAPYQQALVLLEKQQYGAARAAFDDYLRRERARPVPDARLADATYYAAFSALNLFQDDAEARFEAFIRDFPDHPRARRAYFDLGSFYYNQKQYDKAADYLGRVKNLTPTERAEAYFKQGYAYFAQQKFDKALRAFNEIKTGRNSYAAGASYYAAYVELRDSNYVDALADLERVGSDATYGRTVPALKTNVYYQQRDYDRVIDYGELVLNGQARVSNPGQIALLVGEAYFARGEYEAAARYLGEHVSSSSRTTDDGVRYRLGYARFRAGQFEAATDPLKQVADGDDSLAQYAAYYLGLAYLQTGNKVFAATALDQARQQAFAPTVREQASFTYAQLNYDLGRTGEAIDALKLFLAENPNSELRREANGLLSEAYLTANDYGQAIAEIEGMTERSPRVNRAYQRLAFTQGVQQFNGKKFRAALASFEKSLRHPLDPELTVAAHFWQGETYSIGRLYDQAINAYAAVFRHPQAQQYPYHLRARYGIGYAYYNTKQYEKALPHFRAYTEALQDADEPLNYADALVRLADCYYVTKDYAAAQQVYDRAIAQEVPETAYAYYQQGVIDYIGSDYDAARQRFLTVLTQHADSRYYDDALAQLAQTEFEQGNFSRAIGLYDRLIEERPQSTLLPYAYLRRATAYQNQQQYPQAIADYQRILDTYPTSAPAQSALLGLQESLAATGNIDAFDAYLARFKQANPGAESLESIEFETGKTLYFNERYEQAIGNLEEFLRTYPNSGLTPDARYYLAEAYYRQGALKESARYHRLVVEGGTGSLVNRAAGRLAEISYARGEYPAAVRYHRFLLSNPRNRKESTNARVGLMETYYEMKRYDSASFFAQEVLTSGFANLESQSKATLLAGKAALAQQRYDQATDYFLAATNAARDEYAAEAQYGLAQIYFRQGQHEQSLETLYDLNKNYGSYPRWLDASFLLIADNFVAMDELFQARATLKSIAEGSASEETRATARRKLRELETRRAAPTDTTTVPEE